MRAIRTRKFRHSCIDESPENGCHDIFGGGGGTTQTNTIQQSDPWSGVQPYLRDIFGQAQGLSQRGPYTGSYLTPQSPFSAQAIQQQATQATDPNSLVGQSQRELGRTISGQYLSVDSNPAMQAAIDAARRTVNQQFSGDNYGGSANREWLARGAASAASPLLAQERQNQLAALQLAPGLQQAGTQQLASAGAAQEARGQAEIGAQQQAYQAPWDVLQRYQQGVAGGLAAGGTQTGSQQSPYFTNPLASALGLGIGGLSLYNGLGAAGLLGGGASTAGLIAPFAGAAGAGGLGIGEMMLMSDRRLKTDIVSIGKRKDGLILYRFRYIGTSNENVGVMADEVEKLYPFAVSTRRGFKMVDYGRL